MIELKGVSKRYGDEQALEPTDLRVGEGEVVSLIGPSGCGKSTLLRLVCGLIAPSTGTVEVYGRPLDRSNLVEVRRKLGYVIQEGGLFPHLTARRNVTLMADYLGRADVGERVTELAELVGLPESLLDRFPIELSGGQRQRVALMRALALQPQILLMDEPLGALDPMVRTRLQEDLKEIFGRVKSTVLLVTHDLAEAAYLADRIVLMRQGRVLQIGSISELRDAPADPFVTEFIRAQRPMVAL